MSVSIVKYDPTFHKKFVGTLNLADLNGTPNNTVRFNADGQLGETTELKIIDKITTDGNQNEYHHKEVKIGYNSDGLLDVDSIVTIHNASGGGDITDPYSPIVFTIIRNANNLEDSMVIFKTIDETMDNTTQVFRIDKDGIVTCSGLYISGYLALSDGNESYGRILICGNGGYATWINPLDIFINSTTINVIQGYNISIPMVQIEVNPAGINLADLGEHSYNSLSNLPIGLITSDDLTTILAGYLTTSSLTGYITQTALDLILADYLTAGDYSNFVTSSGLTTILLDYVTSTGLTTILLDYVTSVTLSSYVTNEALSSTLAGYLRSQVQANWNQTTTTAADFIKNKPLPTTYIEKIFGDMGPTLNPNTTSLYTHADNLYGLLIESSDGILFTDGWGHGIQSEAAPGANGIVTLQSNLININTIHPYYGGTGGLPSDKISIGNSQSDVYVKGNVISLDSPYIYIMNDGLSFVQIGDGAAGSTIGFFGKYPVTQQTYDEPVAITSPLNAVTDYFTEANFTSNQLIELDAFKNECVALCNDVAYLKSYIETLQQILNNLGLAIPTG